MKIGNVDLPLYYSNLAARELDEACGGINNIGKLLEGEYTHTLGGAAKLICILANGAVTKYNCEIALGIQEGEKKEKYDVETIETLMDASKIAEYIQEVLRTMGLASEFVVPDGVKMRDPDVDLEEIEKEKHP